jgi:anhydro-N-acetylmuramic acid kinase
MNKNTEIKHKTTVLGLMSGTSLDGLDLCAVIFDDKNVTDFEILASQTIPYTTAWDYRLRNAYTLNGFELMQLNHDFGYYCGEKINEFILKNFLLVDYVASHGHTVFHQPSLGFTTQIGAGASIYGATLIPTISDFRSVDVALGGQGAPLVPIGDRLLFSEYDACLNLGGISNISISNNDKTVAQDLGYCNLLLNHLCQSFFNCSFDKDGELGQQGKVNLKLVNEMHNYTHEQKNKSLAREDFEGLLAILIKSTTSPIDQLTSAYHYISDYLATYLTKNQLKQVLVTGGGGHNGHLIKQTQNKTNCKLIIPSSQLVDFKEALIFAFLGYLRVKGKITSLKSVTGAKQDAIGGAIYGA